VAVGGASVVAQLVNGVNVARGLVRLSPDTVAAMKAGPSPVLRTLGVAALRERGMDRGVHST
jgi:hypothetical protein